MLQAAEPHHTIMRQLDNCRFLHDTVFDHVEKNPRRVELSLYHSVCGTYKCILGWYEQLRYESERLLTGESASEDADQFYKLIEDEFGSDLHDYETDTRLVAEGPITDLRVVAKKVMIFAFVFGGTGEGSIRARKRIVARQIKELEERLERVCAA